VARAAVGGALAAIQDAGGGLFEAYPEQVEERHPERGAYFHTGPTDLFEEFGFERDRKIAKWRWVMRLRDRARSASNWARTSGGTGITGWLVASVLEGIQGQLTTMRAAPSNRTVSTPVGWRTPT
jgi:hypothetical protein